jgi:hypothetical protein
VSVTDDEILILWQDLNNAFMRRGADRDTPVIVQFARALLSASIADTAGALSAEQEREQFEADYATAWNAALKNNGWNGDHVAGDVKDLREGDTYGEGRDYLNARWEGWQARAALNAPASQERADADTAPVFRCNDCGGFDIEQVPETMKLESIADTAGAKPISWLIDWPDEPELGHYFAEEPVDPMYGRSRPLTFAATPASSVADGGKGEAVLKLEGELAVAMSIIEAMRSELNAPQVECAPHEAQPVAWFEAEESCRGRDIRSINSIIYSTRLHLQAARPQTGNPVWPLYAAPTPERADAGKDAVLTDHQIRRIWLIETGTAEQDSPLAIIDFARAILAASKETKCAS